MMVKEPRDATNMTKHDMGVEDLTQRVHVGIWYILGL